MHQSGRGHTLVELLVVMLLLSVALAFPAVSLIRHLDRVGARASSMVWEGGAAAAQIDALWSGSAREIRTTGLGLEVLGQGLTRAEVTWGGLVGTPTANVSRWRGEGTVTVRFLPTFGVPDAGGSIYFGDQGSGERVVVRVESGLTRRTRW
jgi:prepilin-type N-terminal cleavage/methylation domain-containing protein